MFNLKKLIIDVFNPQPDETICIVTDIPHDDIQDNDTWKERREVMVPEWHNEFETLVKDIAFKVLPIVYYKATGANSAPFPKMCKVDGEEHDLEKFIQTSTLVIVMSQFSATGPICMLSQLEDSDFRFASMPGVTRSMEKGGLSADYGKVQKRCKTIADLCSGASLVDIEFSTGHRCFFDVRDRKIGIDDGYCHLDKRDPGNKGFKGINLPSGEVFWAPREGTVLPGELSHTTGIIPVADYGEIVEFHVQNNTIDKVLKYRGFGTPKEKYDEIFDADFMRRNIAEVAFGVNDRSGGDGPVLDAEKAGFHFAYGMNQHLGGLIGPDKFKSKETVVHTDIVYPPNAHVHVKKAIVHFDKKAHVTIIEDGEYLY